jgi:hypothetical protein
MLQFQAQETLLDPSDLLEVCLHMLVLGRVFLVGEVDKELRIASDGEALHSQCRRGLEASNQAFILCDVVGDLLTILEAQLYGVVELVLGGRDEHRASPRALVREGSIEVHDPAVWGFISRGKRAILAHFLI